MATEFQYLIYAALLSWLMLMCAATLRARMWTPAGLLVAFGNRAELPEPLPIAGRADRAARNMLENLLLFTVVLVAANAAGAHGEKVVLGAQIFFWARLVYFFVYLAGIAYLRTLVWAVSIYGLAQIVRAAF